MGGVSHGELLNFLHLQSQAAQGVFRLCQLLPGGGALHGQHIAAYLHKGSGELQQDIQPCHGTAGGDVVGLPAGAYRFFCPGCHAPGLHTQLG